MRKSVSLEERMTIYRDTVKYDDLAELNWLIKIKEVELEKAKNIYNLIFVCFISAIFIPMPALITKNMNFNMLVLFAYLIFGCCAIFYGFSVYKGLVLITKSELKVLEYLKENNDNFSKGNNSHNY
ncbi:hypothetical protein ACIJDO_002352 [Enterococcus hirae]